MQIILKKLVIDLYAIFAIDLYAPQPFTMSYKPQRLFLMSKRSSSCLLCISA